MQINNESIILKEEQAFLIIKIHNGTERGNFIGVHITKNRFERERKRHEKVFFFKLLTIFQCIYLWM